MNRNKEPEKIVPYDSSEAASIQTVTGWVSRSGRFWGNDEHMAAPIASVTPARR